VIAGLGGFLLLFSLLKRWSKARAVLHDPQALRFILIGAFFGPFLGVSFSLISIRHTSTGIASTIMAIVPVLIIPFAWLILHERIRWREMLGAALAVAGVSVFFLF
ncbi:MAG TPA: DMT family transporter, partial [Bacteroidales bacterium]|nr:DMT family transporter [Bacteroidales bacterium]